MGVSLTKRKYSNKETMCSLFDTFINHVYGCWLMGQHEWKTVRERVDKIFFLTSLRDNLRWLFCWGPLLCRGTEQCRRWYSSVSHSQSETGSPEKESEPQVISWLRKPQQTNHISNWATVFFFTYLFGVHVKLLTAHGHLFIPLHIFPLKERVCVVIYTNMNIMQNSYTMITWWHNDNDGHNRYYFIISYLVIIYWSINSLVCKNNNQLIWGESGRA